MHEPSSSVPLVVHIVHRLQVGGLENGLVNIINSMPQNKFRHAIVCMTEYTEFLERIKVPGVDCYALHKKEGKDYAVYWRLWKLLRRLEPAIVHTRNMAALECVVPATLAGVKVRVHGEHGRTMDDLDGSNKKYNLIRKLCDIFVTKYVALSLDLKNWLINVIKVSPGKIVHIYNGVDVNKFSPSQLKKSEDSGGVVVGTVGRLQGEKDQMNLLLAFEQVVAELRSKGESLPRLKIVGDGPMRKTLEDYAEMNGLKQLVDFTGRRDDIPDQLKSLDIFVLPSLAEGISNTILESMSTGLPVVATDVGGNSELVLNGETGTLVPAANPKELAVALLAYIRHTDRLKEHGENARVRVVKKFSLDAMVASYMQLYEENTNVGM